MNPQQHLEERDALWVATRRAPAWVLRRVNATRRAAGQPEYRSGHFATVSRRATAREKGLGTLAGVAAYGLSIPTTCGVDKGWLPERFLPTAFRSSVVEVNRGVRNVELMLGHDTEPLADTETGGLQLRLHPRYGLEFWCPVQNTPEFREIVRLVRGGRLAISVAFVPKRHEWRPAGDGKHCRVISAGELRHIALLDTTKVRAAYQAAKVVHTWGVDAGSVSKALHVARLRSSLADVLSRQPA